MRGGRGTGGAANHAWWRWRGAAVNELPTQYTANPGESHNFKPGNYVLYYRAINLLPWDKYQSYPSAPQVTWIHYTTYII
jgi:hypothetical protein